MALFWRKCLFWGIRISTMKNYVDRAARNVDRDQSTVPYCHKGLWNVYIGLSCLLYKSLSVQETTLHSCLEYELIWKKQTKKSWSSKTLKKGLYLHIKIQCYWSSFSLPFFPYQFMLEITVFLIDWSGRKYCSNLFHNHFFSFLTSRTLARI